MNFYFNYFLLIGREHINCLLSTVYICTCLFLKKKNNLCRFVMVALLCGFYQKKFGDVKNFLYLCKVF